MKPPEPTSVPSTSIPISRIVEVCNSPPGHIESRKGYSVTVGTQLAIWIGRVVGATLHSRPAGRVHGGSINECYRWQSDVGSIFVKVAPARISAMFAAEAAGLEELRRAAAVRVPRVLGVSTTVIAKPNSP
jgi:hypothetical protein